MQIGMFEYQAGSRYELIDHQGDANGFGGFADCVALRIES